jgi:hypothetical protein
MPVSGYAARRAKRQQVTRQLDELQAQMEEHLGTAGP